MKRVAKRVVKGAQAENPRPSLRSLPRADELVKMPESDVRRCVDGLPDCLREAIERGFISAKSAHSGARSNSISGYIAGGYVRDTVLRVPYKDIDFFPRWGTGNPVLCPKCSKFCYRLRDENGCMSDDIPSLPMFVTDLDYAFTYRCIPLQIVRQPNLTADNLFDLFALFDCNINMGGIYYDIFTRRWVGECHPTFYTALETRFATWANYIVKPYRVRKFIEKGFYFDEDFMAEVVTHGLTGETIDTRDPMPF